MFPYCSLKHPQVLSGSSAGACVTILLAPTVMEHLGWDALFLGIGFLGHILLQPLHRNIPPHLTDRSPSVGILLPI
jgi:hypothetical protein